MLALKARYPDVRYTLFSLGPDVRYTGGEGERGVRRASSRITGADS